MASFTNQATLRFQGSVIRSNTVTGEMVLGVSISKTSVESAYAPGEQISYLISLVNNSTSEFDALTLTDDLGGLPFEGQTVYPLAYVAGSAKLFVNGVPQEVSVEAGPPLSISGIRLPAQGNAILVYDAAVTAYAQPTAGGEIVNTVTMSGTTLPETLSAQWTLPVLEQPALEIWKEVSPASVQPGETLSYRFTLRNSGNEIADTTLVLADVFQPALQNLVVTLDGAALTAVTDYTYDPDSGAFETVAGVLSVAAAESSQTTGGAWQTTPSEQVLTVTGTV